MQDKAAVRRLKRGDLEALAPLVEQFQVQAVRTAMLITRDRNVAEDVVQSAFVGLPRAIHTFDEGRPFAPWFLRIVARAALQAARNSANVVEWPEGSEDGDATLADTSSVLEELVEARELRAAIGQALQVLPPEQRAAIVLRYYLDMSESEMAAFFAVPPGTIKWRLHTARQQLRALLHPERKGVANG
ncbi:MAG: RNA polymerase sigma factor [Anaerolineae bacterium]